MLSYLLRAPAIHPDCDVADEGGLLRREEGRLAGLDETLEVEAQAVLETGAGPDHLAAKEEGHELGGEQLPQLGEVAPGRKGNLTFGQHSIRIGLNLAGKSG